MHAPTTPTSHVNDAALALILAEVTPTRARVWAAGGMPYVVRLILVTAASRAVQHGAPVELTSGEVATIRRHNHPL